MKANREFNPRSDQQMDSDSDYVAIESKNVGKKIRVTRVSLKKKFGPISETVIGNRSSSVKGSSVRGSSGK